MITEKEAQKGCTELLAKMKGGGWKPSVCEKMGWDYAVKNGPLTVYYDAPNTYSCALSGQMEDSEGWLPEWTEHTIFDDPNAAVESQLRLATKHLANLKEVVEYVENIIKV